MKKIFTKIPFILKVIFIAIFLALLPTVFYKIQWLNESSIFYFPKNSEKFGQLGDFYGGVLNPLISFIGICLAIHTYKNDKKIEQENIQDSIFLRLCEVYSRLLDRNELAKFAAQNEDNKKIDDYFNNIDNEELHIELHKYLNLNEFAPLMRTTYRILESELEKEGDQKWKKIRLFRSQLSENELNLMAWNALIDEEGKIGLYEAALKSGLFKHLKHERLKNVLKSKMSCEKNKTLNKGYSFFEIKQIDGKDLKDKVILNSLKSMKKL